MKIMIASDIHGSEFYCEKMLSCYQKEKADKLLLLGDLLYHGPRNDLPEGYEPKKVISLLNDVATELLCVRGNCDCEVDQMVLEFPVLADYAILYIGNRMIFATHGHKYNQNQLPPMKAGDILLNGHTHVPKCERIGEFLYLNPGSVSIPKENSPRSYLIMEEDKIIFKNLEGMEYMSYDLNGFFSNGV